MHMVLIINCSFVTLSSASSYSQTLKTNAGGGGFTRLNSKLVYFADPFTTLIIIIIKWNGILQLSNRWIWPEKATISSHIVTLWVNA